jgi:hypothetical protein
MNLISDPVRCPFCVKDNFGIVYNPPVWLPHEPRQDTPPREIATSPLHCNNDLPVAQREEMYPPGHDRVVLIDNIRPDWYQALAHRRRVEARRLATATALQQALAVAGQRRRSGSNRAATTSANPGMAAAAEARRMGRRVDGMIRITRDEADEMMLQEAIRQSLQSEEDAQHKRDEEERKKSTNEQRGGTTIPIPSSPITPLELPRIQPSTSSSPPSTSPPSRSFFSAFRSSPPKQDRVRQGSPSSLQTRRPSSTNNLYPPVQAIRRQPSLPDALLTATSASLATAMHDSIIPNDSRPSISSPLAAQSVSVESIPNAVNAGSSSSTVDEILPVPAVQGNQESGVKQRDDVGNVEEREVVESH